MPIFEYNNKRYDISDNEVADFANDFPEAISVYEANGKKYKINASETGDFIKDFPDARAYSESFKIKPVNETMIPVSTHVAPNKEMIQINKDTLPKYQDINAIIDAGEKQVQAEDSNIRAFENQLDTTIEDNKASIDAEKPKDGIIDHVRRGLSSLVPVGTIANSLYEYYGKRSEASRDLGTASDYLQDAKRLQGMSKAETEQGDWGRFFSSFGKTIADKSTLSFGLTDIDNDARMISVSKKMEKDGYDGLSRSEQELLEAAAIKTAAEAYYSSDIGISQQAGQSTAASIPYMLQFLATGGAGAAATSGVKKAVMSAAKNMLKKGVDKTVTKIGAGIVTNAAKAAAMTPLQPALYGDIAERMAGNASFDEIEGKGIKFAGMENQTGLSEAVAKGYASTTIDNFSEMSGELLGGIGKIASKYGKKIPKLGGLIDQAEKNEILTGFNELSKKIGWNGTVGEFFEEQVGTTLNALIVGDSQLKDLVDTKQQLSTLVSVAAMGGFFTGVNAGGGALAKRQIRKSYDQATDELYETLSASGATEQDVLNLESQITNNTNEQNQALLEGMVDSGAYDQDQFNAITNYITRSTEYNSMIGGVKDHINERVEEENGLIKQSANPDMNAIVMVRLDDSGQDYRVTGGNIVSREDGSIDTDASSEMVYIETEEGKKPYYINNLFGISSVVPLEDALITNEQQAREILSQQLASDIDDEPVVAFQQGTGVVYDGKEGLIQRVTPEGTAVVVFSDGSGSVDASFDQLQLIKQADSRAVLTEAIDSPAGVSGEAQDMTLEKLTPALPKTKDGKIDYKQLTAEQRFQYTSLTDGMEIAVSDLQNDIVSLNEDIQKLKDKETKVRGNERISVREELKQRRMELDELSALLPSAQPISDNSQETDKTIDLKAENEITPSSKQSNVSEITVPDASMNDKEFAEWALDESDNTDDLLSAYDISKKLSSVEENLPWWQQELLGKKINPRSFYTFGDRNKVNGGFAKAWLKKDGVEIDTFADELSEYGVPVTPEDIIAFMLDNPTNYIRKTSDLQNSIARKWSEAATQEAGVPISGPESATGKVFIAMKKSGIINPFEYESAVQEESVTIDDTQAEEFLSNWYVELSAHDNNNFAKDSNFEDLWTKDDYEDIYLAIDNELNNNQNDTDGSRDNSETEEDRVSEDRIGENEQPGREEDNPGADTASAEPDRRSDSEGITESTPADLISEAEQQVDISPTEAQKEAGNYKKGHVKLNGFDVTIEQPAGSVRSGRDVSGKEWSVTMKNTYGYFRGTEGIDGDHIDVFLGGNTESEQVFVVDQVNKDGSFDEHKVMMGFNSKEEARDAYLSNYEEGWQGLGNIAGVPLDGFKKWVDSSRRKTKPFASYKQFMGFVPKESITVEDVEGLEFDEVQKRMAIGYLSGNQNVINTIAYENIKNKINERDRSRLLQPDSGGATAKNKVDAEAVPARSGEDGRSSGRDKRKTDRGEQGAIQFDNEEPGSPLSGSEGSVFGDGGNAGRGSHITVQGEPSGDVDANTVDSQSGRGSKVRRHGNTDGRRRNTTGQDATRDAGERGNRVSGLKKEKDDALNDLKKALRELRDAGKDSLSISAVGLNPRQIEATMKVISSGARYGYALIKEGAVKLSEWTVRMKEALSPSFKSMNFSDKEIEAFISDMWEAEVPDENGVYKPIRQWAEELGMPRTKEIVRSSLEEKRERQIQAESVSTKIGNLDNIRESLPFLLPEQHEDVHKTEVRFFSEAHHTRELAHGKGIMFTNGTGTGKTYTGLGVIKRMVKQGKKDILIVVPSQNKVTDWIKDGGNLGLEISALENTKSAGEGVVITTYANFGVNKALYERVFDLVVYDESHRLMENKDGGASSRTAQHYLISNRNEQDALRRLQKRHPLWIQENELLKELKNAVAPEGKENADEKEKIELKLKEIRGKQKLVLPELETESKKASDKTKVLFLSATPFKDHFNLRYAEQYLFSYPEKEKQGYNDTNPEELFYLENFGAAYRMRYNRLEKSGENADLVARQEIEFSQKLTNQGVMSGRMINSEMDYSRDFPTVTGFNSEVFNNALNDVFNYKEDAAFESLRESFSAVFHDYNYSTKLFEVLKTSASIDRMKKHLDEGRKIVVFHRRRQGDVRPPFRFALDKALQLANGIDTKTEEEKEKKVRMFSEIASFKKKYTGLLDYEKDLNYLPVPEQLKEVFGGRAVTLNGNVSIKDKQKAVESFNADNSGVDIIVIQEESGKEGISLHDTTGIYQRVLMNMALPISSITALQIEGRTYRIGNETNAIFEYPLLGLDLEIYHFGSKLNKKLSTTENLAMGNLARDLLSSFANGVLEQRGDIDTNSQGTGGKEYDKRASSGESSLFDKAISAYYNTIKRTAKTKSREGIDYFPTPEPIGLKMVEWGMSREDESFLEPSAGHGAIARWVPSANKLTAIEPSGDLFSKLNVAAGGGSKNIIQERFEDYHIVNKHDVIVMNPPFGTNSKTAADHVEKAFAHLRDGGRLIAIVPDGASMNKRLDKFLHGTNDKGKLLNPSAILRAEILLPSVTFERAGTNVIGKIIIVDRIEGDKTGVEFTEHVDLRDIKDVRELFDNMRDLNIPDRVGLSNKDNSVSNDSASDVDTNESKDVAGNIENIKHSKTGEDLFTVKLTRKLDKKEYSKVSDIARRHNGYWSSYVSSFLFKSREDADAFYNKINSNSVIRFREGANVNEQFNTELQQQIDGILPDRHVYKLGMPSEVLISAGIPDLSIELRADKLATKASDEYVNNHPFELREVTDLPRSVANPIAVFDSKTRGDSKVILTEIKSNGNNFVVAIQVNRKIGSIEVNSVRSIYPKDYVNDIYSWVNEGLLKWVDKEKALGFMSNSSNPADVNNATKGFNSATKIIESFQNSTTQVGKIISEVENISSLLNTPIHIVRDVKEITDDDSSMQKKKRGSKGWYDSKTGEVYLVLPNAESVADAQATVLHEVVGHKGLRGLFGNKFDKMLYKVFEGLPSADKQYIAKDAYDNYSGDIRISIEEYLAKIAETDVVPSLWEKVKGGIKDFFRSIGIDLKITDSDIRYLLWKSKNRIMKGESLEDAVRKSSKEIELLNSVLFRDGGPTVQADPVEISEIEKDLFNKSVMDGIFKFQEGYQDRMLSVKKLIEALEKAKGKKIPDWQNAYLYESTLSSRSHIESMKFQDEKFKPILESVGELMKDNSLANIYNYLYIKHGLERNEVFAIRDAKRWEDEKIAKLDKKAKDYTDQVELIQAEAQQKLKGFKKKDYSGLTALQEELGEIDMAYFVEKFEKENDTSGLWDSINEATSATIKKWYTSGLIDKAKYEYIKSMFKYYIPLRGFDETTAEDVFEYYAPKGGFNSPLKNAHGRISKAENPLAHIASMGQMAILAGNKNTMKQHLLEMVRNNPSSLYSLSEVWYENIGTETDPEWKEVVPKFDVDSNKFEENIQRHNERMIELSKQGYAIKSRQGLHLGLKVQPIHAAEHEIRVCSNGVPYVIYMNTSPTVSQAINGLNNPDATNNNVMKAIGWANRQMAANFTMRNPAFVVSNLSRDLIYSNTSLFIKEGASYMVRFDKNIPKASGAIIRYLRNKQDLNNEVDRLFNEFIENGGETGHTASYNVDEYKKMIAKELRKINGEVDPIKAFRIMSKAFAVCNQWAEDLTRFSTYMTSRQEGRSITRSIVDAKEVTVNFNRKGSGAMGAIGFKSLYVFFNASVQGLFNFAKLVKSYPKRAFPVIGMFAALGYMMPYLNSVLISLIGGDDDDYNNLSDWVRQNNFVIPIGKGRFLYIPLSIELRAFHATGEMLYQWQAGNMKDKNLALESLAKFSELLPLDPAGATKNWTSIVPSSLQPIAQAIANKDFTGKPIYRDTEWNKYIPNWRKAYAGTNEEIINSAKFISELMGGDYATKKDIDPNPAIIEHIIEQYAGGVGKTINQAGKTISSIFESINGDGDIQLRNIPVANRFIGNTSEYGASSRINERYFHNVKFMDEIASREREYLKSFREIGTEYLPKFNQFTKSKDYQKYMVIKQFSGIINNINKVIQQTKDDDAEKLKNRQMLLKQQMLERVDSL